MKLILTSEVSGLGAPGDVVEVKDGYGRNYLLPRGFAIRWTRGAEKQIASIRKAREAREIRDLGAAKEVAEPARPAAGRAWRCGRARAAACSARSPPRTSPRPSRPRAAPSSTAVASRSATRSRASARTGSASSCTRRSPRTRDRGRRRLTCSVTSGAGRPRVSLWKRPVAPPSRASGEGAPRVRGLDEAAGRGSLDEVPARIQRRCRPRPVRRGGGGPERPCPARPLVRSRARSAATAPAAAAARPAGGSCSAPASNAAGRTRGRGAGPPPSTRRTQSQVSTLRLSISHSVASGRERGHERPTAGRGSRAAGRACSARITITPARDEQEREQRADHHELLEREHRHGLGQQHRAPADEQGGRSTGVRPAADPAQPAGHQAVPGHGEQHAGLAHDQHQDDRGEAEHRADVDDVHHEVLADEAERVGQRRARGRSRCRAPCRP